MKTNPSARVLFDVFGYEVRVILARSVAATGRRLHTDLNGCRAAFVSVPVTKENKCGWIVLEREPDAATIAHEASHAVRFMLREHGARNDDETFAYHLDYLVGRIHEFVKRH